MKMFSESKCDYHYLGEDYYGDLDSLIDGYVNSGNVLDKNTIIEVEGTSLEMVFSAELDRFAEILCDAYEDRLSEDGDDEEKVHKALIQSVDVEKLNSLLPKCYYPNGQIYLITYKDFKDWI